MKDWLILLCIGVVAVVAFRERDRWLPQKAPSAAAVSLEAPRSSARADVPSRPPPGPLPAEDQLAAGSAEKAQLAALVGQSQRKALARYPSLGEATSEINIRFNYRYKRMLAEYSPRLQDPEWPVQLADECAQAAGVHPVAAASTPPAPAPRLQVVAPAPGPQAAASVVRPASMPPGPSPSANPPAPPLQVSRPAAAPAQTLVFHPAAAAPPPLAAVTTNPPAAPAPVSSGALPFVTLDAVNQSSGNAYTYNGGYYYGWYDISYRQTVGISINLRNMSRVPAAVNVRWIFFARHAANGARFIFAASGKEYDLAAGQTASFNADSPLMQNRQIDYGWIGDRYMYGTKYEGWLVQLLERGTNRIIKQTGSTGYLEDLAKRGEFTTTLEEYRSKLHGRNSAGL